MYILRVDLILNAGAAGPSKGVFLVLETLLQVSECSQPGRLVAETQISKKK